MIDPMGLWYDPMELWYGPTVAQNMVISLGIFGGFCELWPAAGKIFGGYC
jgi:hypothetical protein